jgi:hypothetical protein
LNGSIHVRNKQMSEFAKAKIKFVDHVQGSNAAEWECKGCGRTWVSPIAPRCECDHFSELARLRGENLRLNTLVNAVSYALRGAEATSDTQCIVPRDRVQTLQAVYNAVAQPSQPRNEGSGE